MSFQALTPLRPSLSALPAPLRAATATPRTGALLALAALFLARGFGRQQAQDPADQSDTTSSARRRARKQRGKLVPCTPCEGTGLKRCQFCDGTTLMRGFTGARVPCVPCQGSGTLGRPCPDCAGMGYHSV